MRVRREQFWSSASGDDKRKLAARSLTEGVQHLGRSTSQHLFVHFGELASHRERALGQRLRDEGQRFLDPEWRLERDGRPRIVAQSLEQAAHLSRLARQIAGESKAWTAITRHRQRGRDGARTGHRYDRVAGGPRGGDQRLTRIRESWRA